MFWSDATLLNCILLKINIDAPERTWRAWMLLTMVMLFWNTWVYCATARLLHFGLSYVKSSPFLVTIVCLSIGRNWTPKNLINHQNRKDKRQELSNEFFFNFRKRSISSKNHDREISICSGVSPMSNFRRSHFQGSQFTFPMLCNWYVGLFF